MLEAHQKINANLLVEVRSKNKVGARLREWGEAERGKESRREGELD